MAALVLAENLFRRLGGEYPLGPVQQGVGVGGFDAAADLGVGRAEVVVGLKLDLDEDPGLVAIRWRCEHAVEAEGGLFGYLISARSA